MTPEDVRELESVADLDQDQGDELPPGFNPLSLLDAIPAADPDNPVPFLRGTFALYRGQDRSVSLVANIDPRSLIGEPGVHRVKLPAGILRALSALVSGTGPLGRLMSLTGRRRGR